MILTAFSDETESMGSPDSIFLMGGYVAKEADWPWLIRAWQERVLDGNPKIPYIHMRQIRNPTWRSEYGLSYNESEERVSEAARVLQSFGNLSMITASIRRSDFKEVFNRSKRKKRHLPLGIDEPDYFCFIPYCALVLVQAHRKWPEATKVNFVVSNKRGISEHFEKFRDAMAEFLPDEDLRNLLGSVTAVGMEKSPPLQAADVLMWHLQRYHAAGQTQKNMENGDGNRLARMIHNGNLDGLVHTWGRSELEQIADNWIKSGHLT